MVIWVAPFLAFTIAFAVTYVELVTSNYPRTGFLVIRCWKLYLYSGIYGAIACGVTVFWGYLVEGGFVSFSGAGDSNIWLRTVVIGFSAKAFLHIRLFTVHSGGKNGLPIGVETLVQPFEPWLLREIDLCHFNEMSSFLGDVKNEYTDLDDVKRMIDIDVSALPKDGAEAKAFRIDVKQAKTVMEALGLYLTFLGRGSVRRLFHKAF
jgi:hypothetical protein